MSGQVADPDSTSLSPELFAASFFYKGRPYGTDAFTGPLDPIFNKGYAVAQFNNRNRFIFDYDYGTGHVWRSITELGSNVERYGGWRDFIGDEVFPTSFEWREWKWAPNYFGHIIEGGITARRMAEWNRAHGVPAPTLTAAAIVMASAVINEMYAHPGFEMGTAATAADLLLFDPLGIALFSMDGFSRFFSEKLRANVWGSQAGLTLRGELVNSGNNIILKLPVSPIDGTSIFIRSGLAFTPGVTFHQPGGLDVSVGFGAEGRVQTFDLETGAEVPELALGGGVFIDRHGSLLVSVMGSEVEHRRFVVNVYPGVVDVWGGRLGGWLLIRDDWSLRFGVSLGAAGGLGIAGGLGG